MTFRRHRQLPVLIPLALFCCASLSAEEKEGVKVDETRYEPITVSGVALDSDGKPLEGAIVYLASTSFEQTLVAKTVTDDQGRYAFTDELMPIEQDHPDDKPQGQFEVFAEAKGHSFAWSGGTWFNPDDDGPWEKDLRFTKPSEFHGRVIDSDGKPIPGVRIGLFNARPVPPRGYDKSRDFFVSRPDSFTILYNGKVTPDHLRNRITDKDGRFAYDELPSNCGFRISVKPPEGFSSRMIHATTATPDKIRFKDRKIEFDNADLVFHRTRSVEATVKYGDTGLPAKNVFVELNNREAGQWKVTDDDGRAELTLPPGEYRAMYLVEFGTPYISRYSTEAILEHKIEPGGVEQRKLDITLEPAAVLDIEIVDAEFGKPLPQVDVWIGDGEEIGSYQWRSWKPPRTSMVDRPRSDDQGKLRLFTKPGLIVVGPGDRYSPKGYPARKGGVQVAVKGGERRSVRLEMRRE